MLSQCLITLLFALGLLASDSMIKKLFAAEESCGEHPADTIDSVRLLKKIFRLSLTDVPPRRSFVRTPVTAGQSEAGPVRPRQPEPANRFLGQSADPSDI